MSKMTSSLKFRLKIAVPLVLLFGLVGVGPAWAGDSTGSAPSTVSLQKSKGNTTYYVDSKAGDDAGNGTTEASAWKSLTKLNSVQFAPGDTILFKSGSTYVGQFKPKGSGTKAAPIVVKSYGEGKRPHLKGEGKVKIVVYLYNVEYYEVSSLEISNKGKKRVPGLIGVAAHLMEFGVAHHIVLRDLYVHDIYSTNKKGQGGCGIEWQSGRWKHIEKKPSWFDGLLIEKCHLKRCDRDGIRGRGCSRDNWYPHRNVRVRHNLLEDIGGDGIVPISCDKAVIEHNRLKGAHMRCRDAACGIWPWNCDDTLVQFNEVSGMNTGADGEAFDSDFNCRRTIFQFNYSHDNPGGFMNVCCHHNDTAFNTGTIIRYNISENDGTRIFKFAGKVDGAQIYNNLIYIPKGKKVPLIYHWHWGKKMPKNIVFRNNIFFAAGVATYEWKGALDRHTFEHNVFFGTHKGAPKDSQAIKLDPGLVDPGKGGEGFKSLAGYMLKPNSPLRKMGVLIPDNGGRDFWGNPIAPRAKSVPGIHQATSK